MHCHCAYLHGSTANVCNGEKFYLGCMLNFAKPNALPLSALLFVVHALEMEFSNFAILNLLCW